VLGISDAHRPPPLRQVVGRPPAANFNDHADGAWCGAGCGDGTWARASPARNSIGYYLSSDNRSVQAGPRARRAGKKSLRPRCSLSPGWYAGRRPVSPRCETGQFVISSRSRY
jgi:hypothetical protein